MRPSDHLEPFKFVEDDTTPSAMRGLGLVVAAVMLWLAPRTLAIGQSQAGDRPAADVESCAALARLDLATVDGGPAVVKTAQLVDVPTDRLAWPTYPTLSGFADPTTAFRPIRRYCDVLGYVAPQNKFEVKLPLPADWNHKLFFEACGGFCGTLDGLLCNLGLARGYASVTSNGGRWRVEMMEDVG